MDITIRKVSIADLSRIYLLEKEIFGIDAYTYLYLLYLYFRSDFFKIAIHENKIIGYIIGELKGDMAHILTIAVIEKYRRKGVGSKLLKLFLEYVKKEGAKEAYLEVSVNRKDAINFYIKHDFHITGVISSYYRDGSDAYIMKKTI